ncbi:MAG TPA: peptide chain release factor N(5)-glutamine methyltransferase [Egibacteraceae bacterium]
MDTTVGAAVRALRARLAAAGVPTPDVDAALLVGAVLGWSRSDLVLRAREPLPPAAAERLEALAARRAAREPLQLLLGSVGFRHLDLEVRPGVFVPRPETEVLVEQALARVPPGGVVVEPCTGSGAVAVAVAAESAAGTVVATDTSPAAVALARANARRAGVDVTVLHGDLFAPLDPALQGRVDVVVSNPPYLAADELAGLEPEVTEWDPPAALVAGPTGHEVVDRITAEAPRWLRPGGWLLLEVADVRGAATAERLRRAGFSAARVLPDLAGRPRVVEAQLPPPAPGRPAAGTAAVPR